MAFQIRAHAGKVKLQHLDGSEVWLSLDRDLVVIFPQYLDAALKMIGSSLMPAIEKERGEEAAKELWDKIQDIHGSLCDYCASVKEHVEKDLSGMSLQKLKEEIVDHNPFWSDYTAEEYKEARYIFMDHFFARIVTCFYVGAKEANHGGRCS